MHVLIVDDDSLSRKLLRKIFSAYGDCDISRNGEEALSAFKSALDEKTPYDLICLDIMMPILDGQETLQRIRQIEEERGIQGPDGVKVIMISALKDTNNIVQAFRSGCEIYLIKPINREKVLLELTNLGLLTHNRV